MTLRSDEYVYTLSHRRPEALVHAATLPTGGLAEPLYVHVTLHRERDVEHECPADVSRVVVLDDEGFVLLDLSPTRDGVPSRHHVAAALRRLVTEGQVVVWSPDLALPVLPELHAAESLRAAAAPWTTIDARARNSGHQSCLGGAPAHASQCVERCLAMRNVDRLHRGERRLDRSPDFVLALKYAVTVPHEILGGDDSSRREIPAWATVADPEIEAADHDAWALCMADKHERALRYELLDEEVPF